MLNETVAPMLTSHGGPIAGILPVGTWEASLFLIGFLAVTSGAVWLAGELAKEPPHIDDSPTQYRAAA